MVAMRIWKTQVCRLLEYKIRIALLTVIAVSATEIKFAYCKYYVDVDIKNTIKNNQQGAITQLLYLIL